MDRIWAENAVDRKRREGLLVAVIVNPSPARNPRYSGGVSHFVKLLTRNSQHIGTLHEIVLPDGTVAHSHPKDYTRRDCVRLRIPAEPDEAPAVGEH